MRIPAFLLLLAWTACTSTAPGLQRDEELAARTMLAALDCEALFTIAGGLKPVSEGFWRTKIDIRQPQLDEIADTRRVLASWRNDELWADIHVLDQEHEGKRFALAWVAHRESLANRVREHRDFFAPYGLMPDTHPAEILAVVERMPRADRHR